MTSPAWKYRGGLPAAWCLPGDAASCVSLFGEGFSSAIVGANTLTDAVAAHPAAHTTGFAGYERRHRNHVRPLQRGAGIAAGNRTFQRSSSGDCSWNEWEFHDQVPPARAFGSGWRGVAAGCWEGSH